VAAWTKRLVTFLDGRFDGLRQDLFARIDAAAVETRRDFDAVAARLEGSIQLLAERLQMEGERADRRHAEVQAELQSLGHRMTRIEARILLP